MSAAYLINLIKSHPVAERKRSGFDFDMADIQEALREEGYTPSRSSVYRAIAKMKITKNERGYYPAPSVAALIGWYTSPNKYSSLDQYVDLAGQSLYDSIANHYRTMETAA